MDKTNILVIVVLLTAVIVRDFYNMGWKSASPATAASSSPSDNHLHLHPAPAEDGQPALDLDLDDHQQQQQQHTVTGGQSAQQKKHTTNKHDYKKSNIIVDTGPNSPGSRISLGKINGPMVKFMYCTSCGYHNTFIQFKDFIEEHHPELTVEGFNYPPTRWRKIGAQIFSVLKFLIIGSILLSSYSFFNLLRLPLTLIGWMSQNKAYAALMTFFLCNFIETQLVSTGAFEIFYNEIPVWSKLQTGRLPSPPELEQILQNQIKMGGGGPDGRMLLLEKFHTAF